MKNNVSFTGALVAKIAGRPEQRQLHLARPRSTGLLERQQHPLLPVRHGQLQGVHDRPRLGRPRRPTAADSGLARHIALGQSLRPAANHLVEPGRVFISQASRPGRSISWEAPNPREMHEAQTRTGQRSRRTASRLRNESGFTLIEVLIAVAGDVGRRRGDDAGVRRRRAHHASRPGAAGRRPAGPGRARPNRHVSLRRAGPDRFRAAPRAIRRIPGTGCREHPSRCERTSREPLVTTPGPGATARVEPGPEEFAVGTGGATITGKLYRYVTWRDENCPLLALRGRREHQARHGRGHARRHVPRRPRGPPCGSRRSSPIPRRPRRARRHRLAGGPGGGDPVTAQSFYLYDTPCGQASRQPQSGSSRHARHGIHGCRGRGQLDLREPGPGQAARPDGRLGAARRHQHARLRVLDRPHGRLPRRSGDARRGLELRSSRIPRPMPPTRRDQASGACTRGAPRRCRSLPSRRAGHGLAVHHDRRGRIRDRAPVRDPDRPRRVERRSVRPGARHRRLRPVDLADDRCGG